MGVRGSYMLGGIDSVGRRKMVGAGGPLGPERPVAAAPSIPAQRALCQKSDTVRALWTPSPLKADAEPFAGGTESCLGQEEAAERDRGAA